MITFETLTVKDIETAEQVLKIASETRAMMFSKSALKDVMGRTTNILRRMFGFGITNLDVNFRNHHVDKLYLDELDGKVYFVPYGRLHEACNFTYIREARSGDKEKYPEWELSAAQI